MYKYSYDYDLIIVGGGLIGASLACAIAGQGLRLALIEAQDMAGEQHASYDERSIAVAYGSQRILGSLGLWQDIVATPIRQIHISEQCRFGAVRLNSRDYDVEAFGYVATARTLGAAMLQRLRSISNIDFYCPSRVLNCAIQDRAVVEIEATIEHKHEHENEAQALQLKAPLLVAADGAKSVVRERLGLKARVKSYSQSAIVANISPEYSHQHIAYERFTPSGPLALLPLTEHRCGLINTVASSEQDNWLNLDDAAFFTAIKQRFGDRLGDFQRVGKRTAYPLQAVNVEQKVLPRVVVIGNAANTLHPVAGQGFNLGMRDMAVLAEVMSEAWSLGQDLGSQTVLQAYLDQRKADRQRVARFTDSLISVFGSRLLPVRLARGLGLMTLDLCPPAKQLLVWQSMGVAGSVSRLGRGLPLAWATHGQS